MIEYSLDIHDLSNEEWRDIKGYEGYYQVSNMGRVKSINRWRINHNGKRYKIRQRIRVPKRTGRYDVFHLSKNNKSYHALGHRLVAMAFIPNPQGKPAVDHIDTNGHNNNVCNLRWATSSENRKNPLTIVHTHKALIGLKHHFSEETLCRIREKAKLRVISDETRRKLSEAMRWEWRSVIAYDLDGKEIGRFENMQKAATALGLRHSCISLCCQEKIKRTGNYRFEYDRI